MDIQKQRGMFEAYLLSQGVDLKYMPCIYFNGESYDQDDGDEDYQEALGEINLGWNAWQQAQKVAVPEGFVLMPIQPTKEMIKNATREFYDLDIDDIDDRIVFSHQAMIEAQEQVG